MHHCPFTYFTFLLCFPATAPFSLIRCAADARLREDFKARLDRSNKELEHARRAVTVCSNNEAEVKRVLEEKLAQEREKRIEHTVHLAVCRIAKRDVTRGWASWYNPWAEDKRMRMILRGAAAKLLQPKLLRAVQLWRRDWEVAHLNAQLSEIAAELEMARAHGTSDAAVKDAMQRQLQEQLAAERQSRIEHTVQMAVRRIGKRDLTRGWVAWSHSYLQQARVHRMLCAAGARLLKPKLVSAVQQWREDWKSTQ